MILPGSKIRSDMSGFWLLSALRSSQTLRTESGARPGIALQFYKMRIAILWFYFRPSVRLQQYPAGGRPLIPWPHKCRIQGIFSDHFLQRQLKKHCIRHLHHDSICRVKQCFCKQTHPSSDTPPSARHDGNHNLRRQKHSPKCHKIIFANRRQHDIRMDFSEDSAQLPIA